jgi:uncharacterized protein (UPF0332 family)
MRPEVSAYLQKARQFLVKARGMLTTDMSAQGWPDEAGRAAYLAGFHAAQAFIFERNGRTPTTHSGVQTEFAGQVRDDTCFPLALRRFLGRAYMLKEIADYETGPAATVSVAQAEAALEAATAFVDAIETSSA